MDLANKPCYPILSDLPDTKNKPKWTTGLTFRERLIVAAMANSALVEYLDTPGCYHIDVGRTNTNIFNQVNAVFKQLEKIK